MKRINLAMLIVFAMFVGACGAIIGFGLLEKDVIETVKITETGSPQRINLNEEELGKVVQTYELILTQFVEDVRQEQLVEGAINGMLASLDDPYSVYMDKETTAKFNESFEPSFEGIGAEIGIIDNKVTIIAPFKDSPAEKAGLQPKDKILKIDGKSVDGLGLYDATLKIRGEKGTTVKLVIERDGVKRPLEVDVIRDEIPFETVYSKIFTENNQRVGYIEIASFSEETALDFKVELDKLERQKITSLIIDLRGNPGGLLSSVQDIAKQLITDSKPFVQTETRSGDKSRFFTTLSQPKSYPIVALIDDGSASAAEILASAMTEVEGYELIGKTTFGKGTVQHPIEMDDGSSIKLTALKWLTADGNWIHNKGVSATVEVEQPAIFKVMPLQISEPLQLDMNNDEVKLAQSILANLGFAPGRNDGYFSRQTEAAVRAFQQAHKLKPTGKIDKQTVQTINEVVVDVISDPANDLQLQTALKLLTK